MKIHVRSLIITMVGTIYTGTSREMLEYMAKWYVNVSKMQVLGGKKTYPSPDTTQINQLAFLGNE